MIEVTKEEALVIKKQLGETVVTTMKQHSSRGKRYAPETTKIFNLLKKLRGVDHIDTEC